LGRPLELSPAAVSFDVCRLEVTQPDVEADHLRLLTSSLCSRLCGLRALIARSLPQMLKRQSKSQGCGFAIAPAQGVKGGVLRHAAYLYGNTGGIDPLEG
jgi:hypothetical protein